MEQNKFDKHIKDALETRTLEPSNDVWSKLSSRLDENKRQNNKSFWYMGVAASVIGLLFVAVQFFNTKPVEPVIVDTPTVKQVENTQVAVEDSKTSNSVLETIQSVENVDNFKENTTVNDIKDKVVLSEKHSVAKETNQIKATKDSKVLNFEEQKIQDIVVAVEVLKSQNIDVTNADIEALLLRAQKEIRYKRLVNSNTGLVDANQLLQEVETDLDQSFRSKVFDALKASFGTVKTVLAQRND